MEKHIRYRTMHTGWNVISNSGASIVTVLSGTQELVAIVLAEKDHWEQDLTQVPGLVEQVANDLDAILEKGMREAVRPLC